MGRPGAGGSPERRTAPRKAGGAEGEGARRPGCRLGCGRARRGEPRRPGAAPVSREPPGCWKAPRRDGARRAPGGCGQAGMGPQRPPGPLSSPPVLREWPLERLRGSWALLRLQLRMFFKNSSFLFFIFHFFQVCSQISGSGEVLLESSLLLSS